MREGEREGGEGKREGVGKRKTDRHRQRDGEFPGSQNVLRHRFGILTSRLQFGVVLPSDSIIAL